MHYGRNLKQLCSSTLMPTTKECNVGCGNSPYRTLFAPRCDEFITFDLPGNNIADRHCTEDGNLPFGSRSIAKVLSTQVLEHVASPSCYLSEARRVLAQRGLLILTTHGVWKYHPDPNDYWRWTSAGLKLKVERAGFRILRFRGTLGPETTALQLWQDAVLSRLPMAFRRTFTRYMQWRIQRADRLCTKDGRGADACAFVTVATTG